MGTDKTANVFNSEWKGLIEFISYFNINAHVILPEIMLKIAKLSPQQIHILTIIGDNMSFLSVITKTQKHTKSHKKPQKATKSHKIAVLTNTSLIIYIHADIVSFSFF